MCGIYLKAPDWMVSGSLLSVTMSVQSVLPTSLVKEPLRKEGHGGHAEIHGIVGERWHPLPEPLGADHPPVGDVVQR